MSQRSSKRQRPDDGGAFHDAIPFHDDFHTVHAREGRLRRTGLDAVWTAATERSPQHTSDTTWTTATSWEPADDPELALDPDGQFYDEVVSGEVMLPESDVAEIATTTKRKKTKRAVGDLIFSSDFA